MHAAPSTKKQGGFTLLELLVVISIIAILTSIGLRVNQAIVTKARMTQAHTECLSLRLAFREYFNQYGYFPLETSGPHFTQGDIMCTLMGEDIGRDSNRRRHRFYETSKLASKPDRQGFYVKEARLNDPWGMPYRFYIDADYEGAVSLPKAYGDIYGSELPGHKVFIHSAGPDRDYETVEDNVSHLGD